MLSLVNTESATYGDQGFAGGVFTASQTSRIAAIIPGPVGSPAQSYSFSLTELAAPPALKDAPCRDKSHSWL